MQKHGRRACGIHRGYNLLGNNGALAYAGYNNAPFGLFQQGYGVCKIRS